MPKAISTGAGTIFVPNEVEKRRVDKLKQERLDREKILHTLATYEREINILKERVKKLEQRLDNE